MIEFVLTWAGTSAVLGLVLHLHLRTLDGRRHASAGDFTIDRFDGLGEFKIDVYDEPGHTCPACLGACRNVLQFEAHGHARRWYYCGRCAPAPLCA